MFGAGLAPAYANGISHPSVASHSIAFWVWTPETNKWINPKYSVKDTPQEQLEVGLGFYKSKEYKEAIREFKKLIKHYPRALQAPEAQYHIGLCLEEQGEFFKAYKVYQVVIDKYPFSELAIEIVKKQYDIGMQLLESANSRGKFIDAFAGADYNVIDVFKTVIKNAPYGDLAAPSQYKIGLYLQEKQLYQDTSGQIHQTHRPPLALFSDHTAHLLNAGHLQAQFDISLPLSIRYPDNH